MPERDDTDLAGGVDMTRHDPDLAFAGVMIPGQLGPIRRQSLPSSARFTRTMSSTGMPSVMQMISGMPASIASGTIRGEGRRHIDHRCVGLGLLHRLGDRIEDRQAKMRLPALAGVTPPTMVVP